MDKKIKESSPLEMDKWIEETRLYHLSLADILKWNIGQKYDVLMLDRNFEEYDIWYNMKKNKPLIPSAFFKHNKATLTYLGNMVWDITFDFGETIKHPVHLCTQSLSTNVTWAAIDEKDKKIHITSEILSSGMNLPTNKKSIVMSWKEFSPQTRVGWRGPMILWDSIDKLPPVYYGGRED